MNIPNSPQPALDLPEMHERETTEPSEGRRAGMPNLMDSARQQQER